ncbi:Ferredoxin [uncultured archaeon]|nr:Ferredoxin [uncultured archaeon]
MVKVSIVKCENYEHQKVKKALLHSLELIGGIGSIIKPGDNVLLKVNVIIGFPPERAATTHPAIVGAMTEIVREEGGVPWVGDSSGAHGYTAQSLELCGIKKVCEEYGGRLINFESTGTYPVKANGKVLTTINIAKPAIDCDVLVSLPKMKTHQLTKYTGAVKNFYGVIPGSGKARIHKQAPTEERLSEALLDIYSSLKPRLAVMDGIVGMEGEGPTNGTPIPSGMILSSTDCVALDAVASGIMGFSHGDILTTRFAHERGLGIGELDQIEVTGEKISDVKTDFKKSRYLYYKLPGFLGKWVFKYAENISRVEISEKECKKCKICFNSCPASAITLEPRPLIDQEKCIKCYCCHELCRNSAVKLKTSYLGRRFMERSGYKSLSQ